MDPFNGNLRYSYYKLYHYNILVKLIVDTFNHILLNTQFVHGPNCRELHPNLENVAPLYHSYLEFQRA